MLITIKNWFTGLIDINNVLCSPCWLILKITMNSPGVAFEVLAFKSKLVTFIFKNMRWINSC